MKMNFVKLLLVSFLSIGTCYAQWTAIRTPTGEAVQCNNWGWVEGNFQTVWHNACTPLEVRSADGVSIFRVPTTEGKCNDNQVAVYQFSQGFKEIKFSGCWGHQ